MAAVSGRCTACNGNNCVRMAVRCDADVRPSPDLPLLGEEKGMKNNLKY